MAKFKFSFGIYRCLPRESAGKFGFVAIIRRLLGCILLAGSNATSSPLRSIYTLSLQYHGNRTLICAILAIRLEVTAGYFGIYARSAIIPWRCASTADGLPLELRSLTDSYNILATLSQYKSGVLFPFLILITDILSLLATIGLFTFPGWHEEADSETGGLVDVKPFPSRRTTLIIVVLTGFASGLAFAASLWQHTAASAIASVAETVSRGAVGASVGGAAVALVWLHFVLLYVAFLGVLVMALSIAILDRLTDEE